MKKIILMTILFTLFVFIKSTHADLIMPGYKPVGFCAKITNLNEYPEINVLASRYIDIATKHDRDIFQVKNNKCIIAYKYADVYLYWNNTSDDEIQEDKLLIKKLKHYYGEVKEENPLKSITENYKLVKDGDTYKLILDSRDVVNEEMVYEENVNDFVHNNGEKQVNTIDIEKVTPEPKVEPIKEKQDQKQNEIKKLSDKKNRKEK
jgi:hypothetical protein